MAYTPTEHANANVAGHVLIFIGQRYAAAWSELGIRITKRQNVIHFYVTVASIMLGFYFSNYSGQYVTGRTEGNAPANDSTDQTSVVREPDSRRTAEYLPDFLAFAITILTAISSVLILVHDRVIIALKDLLQKCEQSGYQFSDCDESLSDLFYFQTSESDPAVRDFHSKNQQQQRTAFLGALILFNSVAIAIGLLAAITDPLWAWKLVRVALIVVWITIACISLCRLHGHEIRQARSTPNVG